MVPLPITFKMLILLVLVFVNENIPVGIQTTIMPIITASESDAIFKTLWFEVCTVCFSNVHTLYRFRQAESDGFGANWLVLHS